MQHGPTAQHSQSLRSLPRWDAPPGQNLHAQRSALEPPQCLERPALVELLTDPNVGATNWPGTSRGQKLHGRGPFFLQRAEPGLVRALALPTAPCEARFFRHKQAFEDLKNVILPTLLLHRSLSQPVRIWSACCATGQDPYSIAITANDSFLSVGSARVKILASDSDSRALARARQGAYSSFEVQCGLPIRLLIAHFDRLDDNMGWRIKPALRPQIVWVNKDLRDVLAASDGFDLIFFSGSLDDLRPDVLGLMARRLAPDGFLVVLAGDPAGIGDFFRRALACESPVYRPSESYQHRDTNDRMIAGEFRSTAKRGDEIGR